MSDAVAAAGAGKCRAVGLTVMPGPQVAPAIEISAAIRAAHPTIPIVWGGYFPTLYHDAAINAPYVDYVVRGEGEGAFVDLLHRLPEADAASLREVRGLTWKDHGEVVHNPNSEFRPPNEYPVLPYERVGDVRRYLRPSFMGSRTAVHQAAIGCRYRCTFCGVVSMFNGYTALSSEQRLEQSLLRLRDGFGANAIQFYDHNFFDNERSSIPSIEVLAGLKMPWWCYAARRHAREILHLHLGSSAQEPFHHGLHRSRSGQRRSAQEDAQGLEGRAHLRGRPPVPRIRRHSRILVRPGGPEDPEGEIEKTFQFVRKLKQIHPQCEVVLYFYSPTPQRDPGYRRAAEPQAVLPILNSYGPQGPELPSTPEEWTQPQWLNYVCHQDAPWLAPQTRQRVKDFAEVLGCRFPTAQDYATPQWGKKILAALASWRYKTEMYRNPMELHVARKFIPLRRPQVESL